MVDRIERGYTSTGETVRLEITRLLNEYKDATLSVTLTGHSLGVSLATLISYDVKEILKVHSSARPIPVTVLRLVNKNDLVPKVPGHVFNKNSWVWLSKMLD